MPIAIFALTPAVKLYILRAEVQAGHERGISAIHLSLQVRPHYAR